MNVLNHPGELGWSPVTLKLEDDRMGPRRQPQLSGWHSAARILHRAPGRPQESSGLLTNAHRERKHPVPGKEASKRLEERYLVHKQTKGSCCFPRTRLEHLIIHRHWIECSGRLLSSAAFCHSGGKMAEKYLYIMATRKQKGRGKSRCPAYPP